jgi:hypothetical protein
VPQQIDMHRSFGSEEELPKEGPSFELKGPGWKEEFRCVARPAPSTLQRLALAVVIDQRGRTRYNAPDLILFVEECLVRETTITVDPELDPDGAPIGDPGVVVEPADDVERWQKLMEDTDRAVELSEVGDIAIWLSEVYSQRPTKQSRR